jgi:hypothetical protein
MPLIDVLAFQVARDVLERLRANDDRRAADASSGG